MSDTILKKKKYPIPMRQKSGARIAAVQLNFQHLFVSVDLQSSISDFLMHYASDVADDMQVKEIDNAYFQQLVLGCEIHKQLIYDIISSSLAEGWKIERLSKADYTILQVAICELRHIPHTPARVIITEYSSIADAYNSDVSFVNAVLDKAARLLRTDEMVAS
tara:strand:- start:362 stop:850 length:489 start_codon:yes stop_codon:yes gene_type:complete